MKFMTTALMLAALGLACGAQAADGADNTQRQVTRRVSFEDFQPYQREYQLANGETVTLTKRGNLTYAFLSKGNWHRVEATGRGTFAALDGSLTIHVDLASEEVVGGWVSLAEGNDLKLAGAPAPAMRFASAQP